MPGLLAATAQPWWTADWVRFASVPLIAGVIGWTSNWVGIRMAFFPIRFVGLWDPWLGWQGIVPRRAHKMASFAVDSAVTNLATVRELIEIMEPEETVVHVVRQLEPLVPGVVDDIAGREYPRIWNRLPPGVKQAVHDHCIALLPEAARRAQPEVIENIDALIDARLMMIEELAADPRVLVDTMMRAGNREFWILIHAGGVFGFLLGLVQVGIQLLVDSPWVLPVFGVFVGWFTNLLALKMIFEPVRPRKVGPFTLHAAFLRRKRELSRFFAEVAAHRFVTVPKVVDRLLQGPNRDRVEALIRRHARPVVDEAIGIARPAARAAMGPADYDRLKEEMADLAMDLAPDLWDDEQFLRRREQLLEEEMFDRLYSMSDEEFSNLLRPVVEEDEWKLVAVGAALGAVSGFLQALLVFGGFG